MLSNNVRCYRVRKQLNFVLSWVGVAGPDPGLGCTSPESSVAEVVTLCAAEVLLLYWILDIIHLCFLALLVVVGPG